jgi:LacI family transcriptional regulator
MVTIKDIAQAAGVSFSTVSKALRDSPLVTLETKRRIIAIAREMGYQPNIAARRLVSKRSGAIGVVWPSIERTALSTLITRVNDRLERRGVAMLLSLGGMDAAFATFRKFQVDAILVFAGTEEGESRVPDSGGIPVLSYGAAGLARLPTVDVNRDLAIRLAVRHLASLGHRRIAYIGRPERPDPLQEVKAAAFRDETRALGLDSLDAPVAELQGMEVHDGYAAARRLLAIAANGDEAARRPTAVICGSCDLVRGVLRAAAEAGLNVPGGLSVAGYDNIPQMAELEVPVTAVGADIDEMAELIADSLIRLVDRPDAVGTVTLEPSLVVRASTAPPPADRD